MSMSMFCYQCEQAAQNTGCTRHGVCGKDATVARLQDVLIHVVKGISMYAHRAAEMGKRREDVDRFVMDAMFATLTNTNFDPDRFRALIQKGTQLRVAARRLAEDATAQQGQSLEPLEGPATFEPADDLDTLLKQAEEVSITRRMETFGNDVTGLEEMLTYGIKGMAAYAHHARILGQEDPDVYAFTHRALDYLTTDKPDADQLVALNLECGKVNLRVMELLDKGNTDTYGHPEPTEVRVTPVKGKAIVVSGHDLRDLHELLKQTEGKGINVYTHGEMLPCLAYPELKKFDHLVGNYGGAWQDQQKEFADFPGAILMTTNCITKPQPAYNDRIFTSGPTGWPGVTHIENQDFTPVIEAALEAEGFAEDAPEKTITIGFARNSVMSVADKVIEAVKGGAIRRFYLIGGCDGAKPGRNYYTELAEQVPEDCVILTLACGKYRFNKMDFGDIGGIPRLLDCGQCNDAYSAIQIAVALADAFDCGVNDLPLSLILSWFEQKAVVILLTLLYLDIKDMRLGPSLPAFLTPNILDVLVEKFDIKPVSTPQEDLQATLAPA